MISNTMRPQRTGTYTSDGRFKTTRQYIARDGLPVRKEFVQRRRPTKESERHVTLRADKWLAENLGKLPTSNMKLSRAIELYIEDRMDDEIARSTLTDDRFASNLLKDKLGEVRIDTIDPFGIEIALKAWHDKPRTAKKVRDMGRKLYKWLAKRGWVDEARNPFAMAKAPRYEPETWEEPMPESHFETALKHVTRADYRAIILLLRWTGIRPISARNLMWAELSEDPNGRVYIRKAKAKTKAGTKPIYVPLPAVEAVRALPKSGLFVFASPKTGKPYADTAIMRAWREAQKSAFGQDGKIYPLYDLKHLRVTELHETLGGDDVRVAMAVGIGSAEVIRRNYRQVSGLKLAEDIEAVTGKMK